MTQVEKNAGKITFGNILLTLLVLGTFIVGGLMYKLYQELTETPEKTANWHQNQQQLPVEVMSPNAAPGSERVYRPAGASAPAPAAVPAAQTAAAPAPTAASAAAPVNPNALTSGEAAPRKPAAPKRNAAAETSVKAQSSNAAETPSDGGVPLHPINVPTPQAAPKPVEQLKERPLKPRPAEGQKSNDAIEELF